MPSLRLLLGAIATEPVMDVLVAAGLTWAAHSSVAVVLLVMSFAAKGVVPPDAAFALVLGANLGTAINPVLEGVAGDDPVARRLPIGNLLNRAARLRRWRWRCSIAIGPWLVRIEPDPARAVADFHTVFNLVLARAVPAGCSGRSRGCCASCCRHALSPHDPSRPRYLDHDGAGDRRRSRWPAAAREALRMADALEAMLAGAGEALAQRPTATHRRGPAAGRRARPAEHRDQGYLTALDPEALSETDHRRLSQILIFATNLEAAGDVLDRDVMGTAPARLKRGLRSRTRSRPRRGVCWSGWRPRCEPPRRCS